MSEVLTKLCTRCQTLKPRSDFYTRTRVKDGCQSHCKKCVEEWRGSEYSQRPDVVEKNRERSKLYNAKLRAEMIVAYGGRCVCCDETEPKFLSIDHINGGGQEHRNEIGEGGNAIARFLRKNGWPRDRFQLLCFNCNCAKGFFGECPHQTRKREQITNLTAVA